jgi:FKBP12-rapamycin complex-associated protein
VASVRNNPLGTYSIGKPVVKINHLSSTLNVITSKQRPRRLTIVGSDGENYQFLLKGHEDLRLDERVMQLFDLVNTLLSSDRGTAKRHLSIRRYPVIPLSQNTGLIGWVPHGDTMHALIRDHRAARNIVLNAEQKFMLQVFFSFYIMVSLSDPW